MEIKDHNRNIFYRLTHVLLGIAVLYSVSAQDSNSGMIVHFDFSNLDGNVVYDISEKHFSGSLENSAGIVTMGTAATGIYNVLSTRLDNGYFNMGSEVGEEVCKLQEYTISAYFRIDEDYGELGSPGNCLWTFSNSEDILTDRNGYMTARLTDQSLSICPGYNTEASGLQSLSFSNQALKGAWHHFACTQQGNVGTIYIDGAVMALAVITNTPFFSLVKEGSNGTAHNWLGRSPFNGEAYLKNTLLWDFRIYNRALSHSEISKTELNVFETLDWLEKAAAAYMGDTLTDETTSLEVKQHPVPDFLEIINKQHFASRIELEDIASITFSDIYTNVELNSGGTLIYESENILRMVFGPLETGLPVESSTDGMRLYPNPATDRLFIRCTDHCRQELCICSMDGKIVHFQQIDPPVTGIDISHLPPGLYIVKRGIHTAKFIRQ